MRGQAQRFAFIGQIALPGPLRADADQAHLLPVSPAPDPDEGILDLAALPQHADHLVRQVALGARDDGDVGQGQAGKDAEIEVPQVKDEQRARRERREDRRPGPLIMRLRVGFVPQGPRQARAQVKHGGHTSGQGGVLPVAPQADLAPQASTVEPSTASTAL